MNKKAKMITTSIVLVSAMALGGRVVFGINNNSPLNINDVIENVVSNNADINLYKEKIRVKEKWYSHKEEKRKNDLQYDEDIKKDVLPLKEEIDIGNLEWERGQTEDKVVVEAKELYYKILIQNKMINIQEKTVERLKKELENKKQKIKVGTEASISLVGDETNLKNAQVKLEELRADREKFALKLNMKMGTPVSGEVKLKDAEVPYETFNVNNLESVIDIMMKKHHTIKYLEKEEHAKIQEKNITHQYANAQDDDEVAKHPDRNYKSKEDDMEDDLIEIKYKMDDEKKNIQSKVRIDYNNILNLENFIEAKKLDINKAETLLNAEKVQLKVGRSTQIQVDSKEEDFLMAKLQYENAKLDYYVAVENFKNYIRVAV
ncbi:TolC family protein [Clostridium botulinum]|uniref:TolC family protein n=1 Tax=Clostridium botulinum TaxID=1491 RepID=UPI0004D86A9A|nr:TolC family protein [Clostridium botulinum]KEI03209.1 hypothetical protein Z952_08585 [Clostridium botulinum C/D str. BKT75002]KEI07585.1 hypothetical protein Z954_03785 [Clostridium botulinum C/D str. BKT2873]QPW59998.1 TolC family protein [Clostridium botulinum]